MLQRDYAGLKVVEFGLQRMLGLVVAQLNSRPQASLTLPHQGHLMRWIK